MAGTSGQVLTALRRANAHRGEARRGPCSRPRSRPADRGVFLDGVSGPWVDERRREVADLVARPPAGGWRRSRSTPATSPSAERQIDRVLAEDPYREQAWRVRLVVDGAAGGPTGCWSTTAAYLAVMRELDMGPSAEMHRLVETFRTARRASGGGPPSPSTSRASSTREVMSSFGKMR